MVEIEYMEIVKRKFPIISWLPLYKGHTALADIVAGITVGLTLIPQSIAYASLAGLPPQYGLYSAISGGLVYALLGTIPEISIAPTALLSLLTYNYTSELGPHFAVLLCFLSGLVELLAGLLNLGFLVEFVSVPVVAGFTSAASIIIASAQVKNLLGLSFKSESFIGTWKHIFMKLRDAKKWDAVLSLGCCVTLLALRQLPHITKIINRNDESENSSLKKVLWFISVSRNAIVVMGCAGLTAALKFHGNKPFSLTDNVDAGLPNITFPLLEIEVKNQTYTFQEACFTLGSGIVVVPLVAILSNIAIAKAFAHGKVVDASQEMFTLGVCNIVGALFSSMPVNGSFSRSAVNNASGVKTPLGGLYTGILVILALCFLTPYFSLIPKATLSSVIVCAVIFMIEFGIIKPLWETNKLNLIPCFVTFLSCLFLGVELGILVGIAVDILFMLYFNARPKMEIKTIQVSNGIEYMVLKPEGAMLFPAVEYVRRTITKLGKSKNVIIIDCGLVTRADYTAAQGIGAACADLKHLGCDVVFLGLKPEIAAILSGFCKDKCSYAKTDGDISRVLSANDKNDIKLNTNLSDEDFKKSEMALKKIDYEKNENDNTVVNIENKSTRF